MRKLGIKDMKTNNTKTSSSISSDTPVSAVLVQDSLSAREVLGSHPRPVESDTFATAATFLCSSGVGLWKWAPPFEDLILIFFFLSSNRLFAVASSSGTAYQDPKESNH